AGDLVRRVRLPELAARVEDGHHDLDRGLAVEGGVVVLDRVHRDAAAVVHDGAGAVGVDGDHDGLGVAGHGLVDGVVHDFVDEVVKGIEAGAADVHARALPDGVEALQDFDLICAVIAVDPAGLSALRRGLDRLKGAGGSLGPGGGLCVHRHLLVVLCGARAGSPKQPRGTVVSVPVDIGENLRKTRVFPGAVRRHRV